MNDKYIIIDTVTNTLYIIKVSIKTSVKSQKLYLSYIYRRIQLYLGSSDNYNAWFKK